MSYLPQELIRKKRDGAALSADELRAFISGVTTGTIADYQIAAMLMAIFFRGMSDEELAIWADAMVHSGEVLDLSSIDRPKVDKHSTGGVGDKISLPLAPAVASCGVAVPMVSGRGLGHTGGTLDKLESIPGFRVDISVDAFIAQVDKLGTCLMGQTEHLAPADRSLYALRDVTGTIESVPLIASSIMSKKLAEGIDGLVLDCKIGHGAFMKTREQGLTLANAIRVIGQAAGKNIAVALTKMDAPIGAMVGNAVEVKESIDVLRGQGPADTRELTVELGAEMLFLSGEFPDLATARKRIGKALDDGSALEVFRQVVEAQGGDPRVVDAPDDVLPSARSRTPVPAPRTGIVADIASSEVGIAALILGAGRRRKEDNVDPSVGVEIAAVVGSRIQTGEPLAYLHHNDRGAEQAQQIITEAFRISEQTENEIGTSPTRIIEVLR